MPGPLHLIRARSQPTCKIAGSQPDDRAVVHGACESQTTGAARGPCASG